MATTKKRTSGTKSKKSTNKGRSTGARKSNYKNSRTSEQIKIISEIYIWILIAVALLLFLSNFGVCGVVGNMLSYFMFGAFGVPAYIFPIVLFFIAGILFVNLGDVRAVAKSVTALILYFDACVFAHLIWNVQKTTVSEYYSFCGEYKIGGGIIGGAIGDGLKTLFGIAGTYVFVIIIAIITIVILTEKSILDMLKNHGISVYESARDDMKGIQQQQEVARIERKKQKEINRQEKKIQRVHREIEAKVRAEEAEKKKMEKAKPVNFSDLDAINISGIKEESQNVHEINIEGLEPEYSGHIDLEEEPTGQFIYGKQSGVTAKLKEEPINKTPIADEHANDGEFKPKERIFVSKEAKEVMNRKPYGMQEIKPSQETMDAQEINPQTKVPEKASSEGKIIAPVKKKMKYTKPTYSLLNKNPGSKNPTSKMELMETANKLQQILQNFGVNVTVTNVSKGPSVTRYELQPEIGTKVSKITALTDDIKLNLAAADIRIEAPIPGKAAVGIEVPNKGRDTVYIRELLESKELKENSSKIAFAAGKDIAGRVVVADIAKMPHMLVAGTTGSGKSVFTNSIIMSILYRATPDEVKLIIIDPKVVEFKVYNGIPHLLYPVVTDPKKAAGILNWAVAEMSERYKKFSQTGSRDLKGYNAKIEAGDYEGDEPPEKMAQIVIVIDELADLMMVAAKEVEDAICRLAQLARAAGIHLIIATQRPSVDVITGLIKANIPSRVALTVSSGTDSRTIIDMNGAEKLLGNGDMLFYPSGYVKPVRLQGAYVSDEEVQRTVQYLVSHSSEVVYETSIEEKLSEPSKEDGEENGRDEYFEQAARLCIEKDKGSTSMLQRQFRVGFNRAARIMEQLYDAGIVGQEEQNKPRKILMSMEQFDEYILGNNKKEEQ